MGSILVHSWNIFNSCPIFVTKFTPQIDTTNSYWQKLSFWLKGIKKEVGPIVCLKKQFPLNKGMMTIVNWSKEQK